MLKKLACIGLSLMIVITLSGCGKENKINEYNKDKDSDVFNAIESKQEELKENLKEIEEPAVNIEKNKGETSENSGVNDFITPVVEKEVTHIDEYTIKDKVSQHTNNSIKDMIIDDFNNDGYYEAFVFTARELSEEWIAADLEIWGCVEYPGEIWYINSKGEIKEVTSIPLREHDKAFLEVINIGTQKCIYVIEYTNGGNYTKIWGLEYDGNDISTIFDDRIHLEFNSDGTIYADYQSMDGWYDATTNDFHGRSTKEYYFYIEDNRIKEYGAISISMDKLREFNGAEEIINNITKEGEVITEILYRENNIININAMKEYDNGDKSFSNYTLEYYENQTVKDITSEKNNGETSGIYKKAIKPECATYPTCL